MPGGRQRAVHRIDAGCPTTIVVGQQDVQGIGLHRQADAGHGDDASEQFIHGEFSVK